MGTGILSNALGAGHEPSPICPSLNHMRIAQVAPLWEKIPPPLYGGTERIVHYLTEELVRRGHKVTLFATGDSKTRAKLVSVYPRPLYRNHIPWTNFLYPTLNYVAAFKREGEFDIIHCHHGQAQDYVALALARCLNTPVVHVLNFTLPIEEPRKDERMMIEQFKEANFISISNSQRKMSNLNWVATVHHGIDIRRFRFQEKGGEYLAWFGRFSEVKGAREAIQVAKRLGERLVLAGKIDSGFPQDFQYYKEEIAPRIDGKQIRYIGELNDKQKDRFLGGAKALLNPILWDEPFGIVPIEAMATGTPVIAFERGALVETVKDGVTGYLCGSIAEMMEKMSKIDKISRKACRLHVEKNFSVKRMVDKYENLYRRLVKKG